MAQMVNSHFDGSQNQRLLQREMERLHTDSSAHLDDALSALTFSFASPEMVCTLRRHTPTLSFPKRSRKIETMFFYFVSFAQHYSV